MAIDYTGYCADPIAVAQRRIQGARIARPEWFGPVVVLYDARPLGLFSGEIGRELGIEAQCKFLLSVNDKERLDLVDAAIDLLYALFGPHRLLIAIDETVFGPGLVAARAARERGQ